MKRVARTLLLLVTALSVAVVLNASSWTDYRPTPTLLAHRGLAQTFPREGLTNETCTARRIHPPEHPYLENTIASMRAAFAAGADIVEFDVQPTADGRFAVIHDSRLECRTEGSGLARERTLSQLKALDIGYGYTADGGKTFPFRGKGVGLIPSLDEVLEAFPDERFLINVKSNDPRDGDLLAARLARLPPERLARLMSYGGDRPMARLRAHLPKLRTTSRGALIACGTRYLALGWTGSVPDACRDTIVLVPANLGRLVWGWPNLFLKRMHEAGTEVFAVGPVAGREVGTAGIDGEADLRSLPGDYRGGVWTNRIDRVAPLFGRAAAPAAAP